ncbi:MAG TPA: DUF2703 domain-containing protein [Thermoclostridium sp.]|nr:DUF2703 domain-containing protein [Thermoclostridium sp.]
MSKTWYPVIDYLTCTECSVCIDKCPYGVYDVKKAPYPVVLNPTSCVDHCHGCGNVCPVGAITYVGDNTGWIPPTGSRQVEECCCSEISDTDVDCRVFEYDGETFEVPPKEKLANAILKSVFGIIEDSCSCGSYELPDNLRDFFDGKKNKKCDCGGDCC